MVRLRGVFGGLLAILGCAPHERPQEPVTPCPAGMVEIGGEASGPLAVARVCMDVTEVTTAAYGACVQAGVCTPAIVGIGDACNLTREGHGEHPINCATWDQAQTYCGWLGKRLPDDEEWLWAAQGGAAATPYPWGRTPPDAAHACWDRAQLGTCAVGGSPAGASPAGVLDMIGNVAEWTRGIGGRAAAEAGTRGRLRGGSFEDRVYVQPIDERVADSARDPATEAALFTSGMRCVVAPHTPVQEVDAGKWTVFTSVPGGLPPRLAAAPTVVAPVRPLANLGVLDRSDDEAVWWSIGDSVVPVVPAVAARLGLDEHVQMSVKPEALRTFEARRWIGDMLLMTNGSSFDLKIVAVEPATFKLRWQVSAGNTGRSYDQVVTPRTLVGLFTGDTGGSLVAYALDSGREVWRLRGGKPGVGFTHIKKLWADDERVFVIADTGVFALDANTGAKIWGGVPIGTDCGVATEAGVLVIEGGGGHRVIDVASGAALRVVGGASRCAWEADSWSGGVAAGQVAGGRLIVFDPPLRDDEEAGQVTLRAFDLATGAELWQRPKLAPHDLLAAHDAVYVTDGDALAAIEAGTGVTRVDVTFGSEVFAVEVQPGGGDAGPLVLVETRDSGRWILGRKPEPTTPEVYVLRGRIVPDELLKRRDVVGVPVSVGGKIVRTGADGRFEARGKAIGGVAIELGTRRGPDERGGSRVRFDDSHVILDGTGKYDAGDITLSEWSVY